MLVRFTKMHGAGNDYIYINGINSCPENLAELSRKMSDRHKGVGSDGLVVIMKSEIADFRMRMFNADGSEGNMCGNASRCIAKYVYERGLTEKRFITLETKAGIKTLSLDIENSKVKSVTVDMGVPSLNPKDVPTTSDNEVVMQPISTQEGQLNITAISVGNPHGVIFVDDLDCIDVHKVGKEIENHVLFPEKANVEFAQVLTPQEIRMRVWERGSGETMACGTGACATAVAAVLNGICDRKITIHLLGGDLSIKWDESNDHVYMTGPATFVFDGEYEF